MEAPSLRDHRRPITSVSSDDIINCVGSRGPEHKEEEEEEDSFFELELTVPRFHSKIYNPPTTDSSTPGAVRRIPTTVENAKTDPKHNFSPSKRKILPIESSFLRPQSPISLLKSAPKFRVFMMFRRSKSVPANADNEKTEGAELRDRGRKFFTLRFQLKDLEPSLRRNRTAASCSDSPLLGESNSKRFSKEAVQKYLRLVKPLSYVRVSRRKAGGPGLSGESPTTASLATQTPGRELHARSPAGSRVVSCRHLGKSKSASASVAGIMSPARRDDSLVQQHDGIEGAILHCKRSFSSSSSSSRAFSDLSPLSRSASAHETSPSLESARSSSDDTRSIF